MTKIEMSTESVSLNPATVDKGGTDKERMRLYKTFAVLFSYPDEEFFAYFPGLKEKKQALISQYDSLFRVQCIWLYTTEYKAKHNFQKAQYLSDIMAFYRAFGLEPDKERPDALSSELEFMHYLIFKKLKASGEEKSSICFDAQRKFFTEHLYPAAKRIVEAIISKREDNFYKENARTMLEFLESEKKYLSEDKKA